jgi:DNA repair exonuclease SbcCD ATPase subunit
VITVKYPPPFLSLPSTALKETSQRSILEELFGQKELTEKGRVLKEVIKETIAEIKRLTELNERIEEEVGRYQEQLKFAEESIGTWSTTHKTELASIKASIVTCEAIDYETELAYLHKMDDVQEDVQKKQNRLNLRQVKLDDHAVNVQNAKDWVITNETTIRKTKQLLSPYKDIDFEAELNNLNQIELMRADHAAQLSIQRTLTSDTDTLFKRIDTLNTEVKTLESSKCPYCDQTYHANEDKIAEKKGELHDNAIAYNTAQTQIDDSKTQAEDLIQKIDGVSCMFDSVVDHTNSKNSVTTLETKLSDAQTAENPYNAVMDPDEHETLTAEVSGLQTEVDDLVAEFKAMDEPERTEQELYAQQARCTELKKQLVTKIKEVNPHEEAVDRLTKVFEAIDEPRVEEIDELQVKLEHQQFLLKLLTKSDSYIRQALLDVNLPLLNTRMRHYLDIIGLPHKVEFTKDMSISISQFNNEIGYNNLSGGQQARINLAISFSFRDVVQARHQKINVCVLDECLDTGLSNLGVKVAAKMIKQVAEENELSMYVITHRDEIKSSFNKTLKAVLKGGLTTVEFS